MERINNAVYLKYRRTTLRKDLTPPEARLWIHIKGTQLGAKFRRQHSVGNYILDFYCPQYKLALEIDGAVHDSKEAYEYDQLRTDYLEQQGVTVIRFTNTEIMHNLDGVLAGIKKHLE